MKGNKVSIDMTTGMGHRCLLLSERNQTQKVSSYMISLIWHTGKAKLQKQKTGKWSQDRDVREFPWQSGSTRDYFGGERTVLYLDYGAGYKTTHWSKLTELHTEKLVNFTSCGFLNKFKNIYETKSCVQWADHLTLKQWESYTFLEIKQILKTWRKRSKNFFRTALVRTLNCQGMKRNWWLLHMTVWFILTPHLRFQKEENHMRETKHLGIILCDDL